MLTGMDEVVGRAVIMTAAKGACESGGMLFARETHRTEPSPGYADTAGSRHTDTPTPCSAPGMFQAMLEKP